jgi:hypothetical protein
VNKALGDAARRDGTFLVVPDDPRAQRRSER